MTDKELGFYLPDRGETRDDRARFGYPLRSLESAAEEAAQRIWDPANSGDFPCTIVLVEPSGKEHRFIVDVEVSPVFFARKLKAEAREE